MASRNNQVEIGIVVDTKGSASAFDELGRKIQLLERQIKAAYSGLESYGSNNPFENISKAYRQVSKEIAASQKEAYDIVRRGAEHRVQMEEYVADRKSQLLREGKRQFEANLEAEQQATRARMQAANWEFEAKKSLLNKEFQIKKALMEAEKQLRSSLNARDPKGGTISGVRSAGSQAQTQRELNERIKFEAEMARIEKAAEAREKRIGIASEHNIKKRAQMEANARKAGYDAKIRDFEAAQKREIAAMNTGFSEVDKAEQRAASIRQRRSAEQRRVEKQEYERRAADTLAAIKQSNAAKIAAEDSAANQIEAARSARRAKEKAEMDKHLRELRAKQDEAGRKQYAAHQRANAQLRGGDSDLDKVLGPSGGPTQKGIVSSLKSGDLRGFSSASARQASSAFNTLGKSISNAGTKMAQFKSKAASVIAGLVGIGNAAKKTQGSMRGFGGVFGAMNRAFQGMMSLPKKISIAWWRLNNIFFLVSQGARGVQSAFSLLTKGLQDSEELFEMREKLALGVKELQTLTFAAKSAGVSMDTVQTSIRSMNRALSTAAADPESDQFEALSRIFPNEKDMKAKLQELRNNTNAALEIMIAYGENTRELGAERVEVASLIFGRGAIRFIPAMQRLAQAGYIKEIFEDMDKLGFLLGRTSEEMDTNLVLAEEFRETWNKVQLSLQEGIIRQLNIGMGPAFLQAVQNIKEFIEAVDLGNGKLALFGAQFGEFALDNVNAGLERMKDLFIDIQLGRNPLESLGDLVNDAGRVLGESIPKIVSTVIGPALKLGGEFAKGFVQGVADTFKTGDAIAQTLVGAFSGAAAGGLLGNLFPATGGFFGSFAARLKTGIGGAIVGALAGAINEASQNNGLEDLGKKLGGMFIGAMSVALLPLKAVFSALWADSETSFTNGAATLIEGFHKGIQDGLQNIFPELGTRINNGIATIFTAIAINKTVGLVFGKSLLDILGAGIEFARPRIAAKAAELGLTISSSVAAGLTVIGGLALLTYLFTGEEQAAAREIGYGWGSSIAAGMVAGLKSGLDNIISTVESVRNTLTIGEDSTLLGWMGGLGPGQVLDPGLAGLKGISAGLGLLADTDGITEKAAANAEAAARANSALAGSIDEAVGAIDRKAEAWKNEEERQKASIEFDKARLGIEKELEGATTEQALAKIAQAEEERRQIQANIDGYREEMLKVSSQAELDFISLLVASETEKMEGIENRLTLLRQKYRKDVEAIGGPKGENGENAIAKIARDAQGYRDIMQLIADTPIDAPVESVAASLIRAEAEAQGLSKGISSSAVNADLLSIAIGKYVVQVQEAQIKQAQEIDAQEKINDLIQDRLASGESAVKIAAELTENQEGMVTLRELEAQLAAATGEVDKAALESRIAQQERLNQLKTESERRTRDTQEYLNVSKELEIAKQILEVRKQERAGTLTKEQAEARVLGIQEDQSEAVVKLNTELNETNKLIEDQQDGLLAVGDLMKSSFTQIFDSLLDSSQSFGDTLKDIGKQWGRAIFESTLESKFDFDKTVEGNFLDLAGFAKNTFGDVFSGLGDLLSGNGSGSFVNALGSLFTGGSGGTGSSNILGQIGQIFTGKGGGAGGGGINLGGILSLGGSGGIINLGGSGGGLNLFGSGGGYLDIGAGLLSTVLPSTGILGAGSGALAIGTNSVALPAIGAGYNAAAFAAPANYVTPLGYTGSLNPAAVSVPTQGGVGSAGTGLTAIGSGVVGGAAGLGGSLAAYSLIANPKTNIGIKGYDDRGIINNLNTAGLIGAGVGGIGAGVGAGIALGASAGSAVPVLGTIVGAVVGALAGIGINQLGKGIDVEAMKNRRVTGVGDPSTSAGFGAALLTGGATVDGIGGSFSREFQTSLFTGIPGLSFLLGDEFFQDLLFGILGIPTVGTALRTVGEKNIRKSGLVNGKGFLAGSDNQNSVYDRENYRGSDFHSPLTLAIAKDRGFDPSTQTFNGKYLDNDAYGQDLLDASRSLVGDEALEKIRGFASVIASLSFGDSFSEKTLGQAQGQANILTEMFGSQLANDWELNLDEEAVSRLSDAFDKLGITAPAAFEAIQKMSGIVFSGISEGLDETSGKIWWDNVEPLDFLKDSAEGVLDVFGKKLPAGIELGSLVMANMRQKSKVSFDGLSADAQKALGEIQNGAKQFLGEDGLDLEKLSDDGKAAFARLPTAIKDELLGKGSLVFDSFSDEAKKKLDELSQDGELWAETFINLLQSGLELDVEGLTNKIADIQASALFLNEQIPNAIAKSVGDGSDVIGNILVEVKAQAVQAFDEIQKLQLGEKLFGTDDGKGALAGGALEPVMNVIRRLTTTDEFDLTTVMGVQDFQTNLVFALAIAKKNLEEMRPELEAMVEARKEAEELINEVFAETDAEKAARIITDAFSGIGGGVSNAIAEGLAVLRETGNFDLGFEVFSGTLASNVENSIKQATLNALIDTSVIQPIMEKHQDAFAYITAMGLAVGFNDPRVKKARDEQLKKLRADLEAASPMVFDAAIELNDESADQAIARFADRMLAAKELMSSSFGSAISSGMDLLWEGKGTGAAMKQIEENFKTSVAQGMIAGMIDALIAAQVFNSPEFQAAMAEAQQEVELSLADDGQISDEEAANIRAKYQAASNIALEQFEAVRPAISSILDVAGSLFGNNLGNQVRSIDGQEVTIRANVVYNDPGPPPPGGTVSGDRLGGVHLPGFRRGGATSGAAVVGEAGKPELVEALPGGGFQVTPLSHGQANVLMGKGTTAARVGVTTRPDPGVTVKPDADKRKEQIKKVIFSDLFFGGSMQSSFSSALSSVFGLSPTSNFQTPSEKKRAAEQGGGGGGGGRGDSDKSGGNPTLNYGALGYCAEDNTKGCAKDSDCGLHCVIDSGDMMDESNVYGPSMRDWGYFPAGSYFVTSRNGAHTYGFLPDGRNDWPIEVGHPPNSIFDRVDVGGRSGPIGGGGGRRTSGRASGGVETAFSSRPLGSGVPGTMGAAIIAGDMPGMATGGIVGSDMAVAGMMLGGITSSSGTIPGMAVGGSQTPTNQGTSPTTQFVSPAVVNPFGVDMAESVGEKFAKAFMEGMEKDVRNGFAEVIQDAFFESTAVVNADKAIEKLMDDAFATVEDMFAGEIDSKTAAENIEKFAEDADKQLEKIAKKAKELAPLFEKIALKEAFTLDLKIDSALQGFAENQDVGDLGDNMNAVIFQAVTGAIVSALLVSGPIADALEEFNTEVGSALEEGFETGMIDTDVIGKAGEKLKTTVEATMGGMGPMFESLGEAFGNSVKSDLAGADQVLRGAVEAAFTERKGLDEFTKNARQAIYEHIRAGLIDAFIEAALVKGALAPVFNSMNEMIAALVENEWKMTKDLEIKKAELKTKALEAIGVIEGEVFQQLLKDITDLNFDIGRQLGAEIFPPLEKASEDLNDSLSDNCQGACDVSHRIRELELGMIELSQLGRSGTVSAEVYDPYAAQATTGQKAGGGTSAGTGWVFNRFAKGGLVTGPTIGLIGEAGPEAVLPLGPGTAPAISQGIIAAAGEMTGASGSSVAEIIAAARSVGLVSGGNEGNTNERLERVETLLAELVSTLKNTTIQNEVTIDGQKLISAITKASRITGKSGRAVLD